MTRARVLALASLVVFLVGYRALAEVAARYDFMAALSSARQGRPLLAGVEILYFALRILLLIVGPPLVLAALLSRCSWRPLRRP